MPTSLSPSTTSNLASSSTSGLVLSSIGPQTDLPPSAYNALTVSSLSPRTTRAAPSDANAGNLSMSPLLAPTPLTAPAETQPHATISSTPPTDVTPITWTPISAGSPPSRRTSSSRTTGPGLSAVSSATP